MDNEQIAKSINDKQSVNSAHIEQVVKSMDIEHIAKTIVENIAKKLNETVLTTELINKLIDDTYSLLDTKETSNFTNIHDLIVNISRRIITILELTYEVQIPNSIDYDKLATSILNVKYRITQNNDSILLSEFEEKYKDKSIDDKYLLAVNEPINLFHDLHKKYNFNYDLVKLLTKSVEKKNADLADKLLPYFINNMSHSSEYKHIVDNLYTITIINDNTNLTSLIHAHIFGKSNVCLYCTLSNYMRTILLVHRKNFLNLMKYLPSDKSCCVNTKNKNIDIISKFARQLLITGNPDAYHTISMYFDTNIDLNIIAEEVIDNRCLKSVIYLLNYATIIDCEKICEYFNNDLSNIIKQVNNYKNLLELREYLRVNQYVKYEPVKNIDLIDQILKFE